MPQAVWCSTSEDRAAGSRPLRISLADRCPVQETVPVALVGRVFAALGAGVVLFIPALLISRDAHGLHLHCSENPSGCSEYVHPVLDFPVVCALIASLILLASAIRPSLRRNTHQQANIARRT